MSPPHLWVIMDKSTSSGTINQATIIVARDALNNYGIAADGPYQASGFRDEILEKIGIGNGPQNLLDLPDSLNAANLINLGVLDVKYS